MLDISHYFNERTRPVKQRKAGSNAHEVNCVPHFDPDLFSLTILSTCDGLQLYDQMKDEWIDGSDNSKDCQRFIDVI
ncbi:unnamed protein product [Rotaria magnacalcarata]|uniref:Uncharacterized protein n=2 Tax=Rotaria magnacalcarata TaxID=392030 RepID=A0A819WST8_9BILA|nr:unnamed protein product [Rotaria magnacalcarata]CAF4131105.1 unnamed protein product [Rotaria magnacalcarata]